MRGVKKTHTDFVNELIHSSNSNVIPIGIYNGAMTKIEFKCTVCTLQWLTTPDGILRGDGCPNCANISRRKTHEQFISELKIINPKISVIGHYINNATKIECRCEFGHNIMVAPIHLLQGNRCCTVCDSAFKRRTHEQFVEELAGINSTIIVIGQYTTRKKKVLCKCSICEGSWTATPTNLISRRSACPFCNKSKGERLIREYLLKYNVIFEQEKRFSTCRNKRQLPFDFALHHNVLIEFDGEHHFKKTIWGWKSLARTIRNDRIKNQWALQNGYHLYRIPYTLTENQVLENVFEIIKMHDLANLCTTQM